MDSFSSAQSSDIEFRDLSNLLNSYKNADGTFDPEKAPPDMRDIFTKLQEVQNLARTSQQAGITVTPEAGFVIKTVDGKGKKVFINVCGSPSVLAPGGWKDGQMSEEVRTALERAELEDPGETLRFPLSMGQLRTDQDHKGIECLVLDIVFNVDVLKQAQTFRKLKIFLVELAMGWASQKHSVALDPNWKLPKMRYKGDKVLPQCLRLDRKPLVTELGDVLEGPSFPLVADKKQASAAPSRPAPSDVAKQAQTPQTARNLPDPPAAPSQKPADEQEKKTSQRPVPAHEIQYRGRPAEAVEVSVSLEQAQADASSSGEQLSVEVHMEQVVVKVPGAAPLELRLPFGVDANLGSAVLVDGCKRLSLRLPFKPYRSFIEEMKLEQKPFDYMNCSYMQIET